MAELRARSEQGTHWWVRSLTEGRTYTLGRSTEEADWVVDWDRYISRVHAVLHWKAGRLWVRRHPQSTNPIFWRGQAVDEFTLAPGERFVIGETVFEVREEAEETAPPTGTPEYAEIVYPAVELSEHANQQPAQTLLSRLPELLGAAATLELLNRKTLEVILAGVPHADWAALVQATGTRDDPEAKLIAWLDPRRPSYSPHPSRRLVCAAVQVQRKNVLHLWATPSSSDPQYTVSAHLDWALCVPLLDAPEPDLALYVAGRIGQEQLPEQQRLSLLKEEVQYVDLVARVHASLRRLYHLQRKQSVLVQFFPRPILALLSRNADLEEVFRPREVDVTVLFCDLRGSSRFADRWEHDLRGLWHRLCDALSIMSQCIADFGGVLGDFHGDAAMGFWGWPIDDAHGHEKAARAALAIYRRFHALAQQPGHPLHGFRCGIGIASGRAIAGRLGTPEQFKVTVYGPPVNLAARLETLTKLTGATILLDKLTAQRLRLTGLDGWALVRRIGQVRPRGMERAVELYELLPAEGITQDGLHAPRAAELETAVAHIEEGNWALAAEILHRLNQDPVADRLLRMLKRLGYTPPPGWDGTLPLEG